MKKILFLIYSLDSGGAEKVLIDTVNNLGPEYDVTVHTLMGHGTFENKLNPNIHYKSIIKIKNQFLRKIASGIFQYVIPPKWTYHIFYNDNYDYEVAYMEGYPTKALTPSKRKKIAWVHIDVQKYQKQDRLFKSLEQQRKCYQTYYKIICVSDEVKKSFEEKFGLQTDVILNIYDNKKIEEDAKTKNPYIKDGLQIVSVANMIPRKRFDRFILIAEELKKRNFNFCIHIVGDGPEYNNLNQKIKEKKLENVIKLEGFQNNPYPYIKNADIYVCTSEVEGYSTVVAESFILGVPVITTYSAGMKMLFQDKMCGIVVNQNTEEQCIKELTDAIYYFEKNNEIYDFKQQAEERGKELRISERIKDVYQLFEDK